MADNNVLSLTELIDLNILQQIQDAFSDMTGMAALTADHKGIAVTKGSNFTDFCMKYTRRSELGNRRCENCDRKGGEMTLTNGRSCSYYCHAGLVDFAAPIMANGQMIGSFIGGQVLTEKPDLDKVRAIAEELGIDPDEYVEAVKKVRVVDKETVDKAARSLFVIANVLTDMAYKSHNLYLSNLEIEKNSHMKSDFLANMSHEIRTPMNAVLGMVDLALREEMSPAARNFLKQIKVSGKNLLVIINDILDFSKIESGKMEIIPSEYEPYSVLNDVANVINNRIGDKNIEFTMDISPELPRNLFGDNFRIHQILLNLLNNAVKFTQSGEVHLRIACEPRCKDEVMLKIAVADTGIGIKKQDMKKLFNSFQQVDSKRNRNVEGTGLGLAISQQLLMLMNGKIRVESEYGKGTTFFVELPQRVVDPAPEIPKTDKPVKVAVRSDSEYFKKQLYIDLERLGAECVELAELQTLDGIEPDYLIAEESLVTDNMLEYAANNRALRCIVVSGYASGNNIDLPNVRVLRKPVYSLVLYNAMGISSVSLGSEEAEADLFNFTAPDARVLIVDDNTVNLAVASGLIEPFDMHVDTAASAGEAIEKLKQSRYDIIFMDHMMPEVDGVEATRIIRRLMPDYNGVPIIALTANAVSGAKEMFLSEGMDDFVAKPIELKEITAKLRRWLPKDKIIPANGKIKTASKVQTVEINGLDTEKAIEQLGSPGLYMSVLKEYYGAIGKKAAVIEDYANKGLIKEYTIEVHSLKSTSRQIGATELSNLAAELEKAGNDGNTAAIAEKTEALLMLYRGLAVLLKPYFPEEETSARRFAEPDEIIAMLNEMQEALDNFDTLQIDEVIEKMSAFDYSDDQREYFENLCQAAEFSDIDSCGQVVAEWKGVLDK